MPGFHTPQQPIHGAPTPALDAVAARRLVTALAAQPRTSSGSLLTLADQIDAATPHAAPCEQPALRDVSRRLREMAPLWPDGMSGISPCGYWDAALEQARQDVWAKAIEIAESSKLSTVDRALREAAERSRCAAGGRTAP